MLLSSLYRHSSALRWRNSPLDWHHELHRQGASPRMVIGSQRCGGTLDGEYIETAPLRRAQSHLRAYRCMRAHTSEAPSGTGMVF